MREALEQLPAELESGRSDLAELVVLGARAKAQQRRANGPGAQEARARLACDLAMLYVALAERVRTQLVTADGQLLARLAATKLLIAPDQVG